MEKLIISLIIVYIISHTFLFRFQRVTLGIARRLNNSELQAILTPLWVTIIYWNNFILLIGLSILIFKEFSWLWTSIFLIYSFIITPLVNFFLPIPSYKSCFVMIKSGLQRGIERSKDDTQKLAFSQLFEAVKNEEIHIKE